MWCLVLEARLGFCRSSIGSTVAAFSAIDSSVEADPNAKYGRASSFVKAFHAFPKGVMKQLRCQ